MTKSIPGYLRLHVEAEGAEGHAHQAIEPSTLLVELCRTFEQATGWPLRYIAGASPPDGDAAWSTSISDGERPSGSLRIDLGGSDSGPAGYRSDLTAASDLAQTFADLLSAKARAERTLRDREAELAAGVPVVPRRDGGRRLGELLEHLLGGLAKGLDCPAAGMYLLDDATTELKLRASAGLPAERLSAPARSLTAATADLEAMAGHAVVLRDTAHAKAWNPPEDFPAALCVPVSSDSTVLGTLWVFADHPRDFDDAQANQAEIVAGRMAAELEREMLARELLDRTRLKQDLVLAERREADRSPTPLFDHPTWDVAGWTKSSGPVGGSFHDWMELPDQSVVVALGDAGADGIAGALAASGMRSAWRALAESTSAADKLLSHLNRVVWGSSTGDDLATAFCAQGGPKPGQLCFGWAGFPGALLVGQGGYEILSQAAMPLGADGQLIVPSQQRLLAEGDYLLVFNEAIRRMLAGEFPGEAEEWLGSKLLDLPTSSAGRIVEAVTRWGGWAGGRLADDASLLVIKRK